MYTYSIVTGIFNDKDKLHEVEDPRFDVEYIAITNNAKLQSKTWKIILSDTRNELNDLNPTLAHIYVKCFPFNFCQSDCCLYIDSCIKIKKDITEFVNYLNIHNYEYATSIKQTFAKANDFLQHSKNNGELSEIQYTYFKNKYAENISGIVNDTLIYRKNTSFTKKIDIASWEIFNTYYKDIKYNNADFALTLSLYKNAYHNKKYKILDQNILYSPLFDYYDDKLYLKAYNDHNCFNNKSFYYRNRKVSFQNKLYSPLSYLDITNVLPLLTVVITCYNKEKTIKRAIESVKRMSYKNWECIIVNNNSTDNSLNVIFETVKNDNRFTIISQKNKNLCHSRNIGAFAGNGEYLVFVDGDDEIGEHFCECSINEMENNENFCISTGIFLRQYLSGKQQYFCTWACNFNRETSYNRMRIELNCNQFPVTSVIRMQRFRQINGFKIGTEYTQEDWEMFIRYFYNDITKSNVVFIYDDITVIMYTTADSKTFTQTINWNNHDKEKLEMYNENPKIYEKFLSNEEIENIKNIS